ncbi:MAG: Gldg family protein, partial [Bryobacteraceae bacterium]
VLASRLGGRIDVTSEKVHSLSEETRRLIGAIDPKRPVFIQAYLSPEVPRSYLAVRSQIASYLREYGAIGRDRVFARVIETVKYSTQAREARERYAIQPFRVPVTEESTSAANEIFLGLVFTCGSEEFVIPSFDRGLPVEYELTRSMRVVSRAQRRKIGILQTGARLFGGFDFQSRAQSSDWSIIGELRKQYEVTQITPDAEYPADLDVLLVALPHTLAQPQLERLTSYVRAGKPALVFLDPLPAFNLNLSPAASQEPSNPLAGLMPQQPPAAPPASDVRALLAALGVEWQRDRLVWDQYNPHPQLRVPPEVVFVGQGSQSAMPFQTKEEMTSGLQEVVMLYPGAIRARNDGKTTFTPLLTTGKRSGALRWDQLVQRTMFGMGLVQGLPHNPSGEAYVLAAKISGAARAVVFADADMMGEEFFELRRRGIENLNFDNVTLILNAVDDLAGDRSFLALRKRRPRLRTLEAIERRTQVYEEKRAQETQQAQAIADRRLREAQARLDAAVAEVEARRDLDDQTRQIMISNLQTAENRRLQVARANIEDERQRQIENARATMEDSVRSIQGAIKLLAVTLPPIPAFVLFILVSVRKVTRERLRISSERLITRSAA